MSLNFFTKLRKASVNDIWKLLNQLGVIGLVKSLYYSVRYTGKPATLFCGQGSSIDIATSSTIDIGKTFEVGVTHTRIIHPVLGGARLDVDTGATFRTFGRPWVGPGTVLNIRGDFKMGHSYINGLARIHCFESITIGNNCAIAWDVDIMDSHSHQLSVDGEWRASKKSVVIGDGVWIGAGATILPGVEIGDGAVIAANSVVNCDIPSNTLAAGSPAEVVESDVEWR